MAGKYDDILAAFPSTPTPQASASKGGKYDDILSAFEPKKPDYGQVIKTAAKESFSRPASFAKDLGTNPVTMARAIPYLMGTAGAVSGGPMGSTMGTVGGRQISNAALRALDREEFIPSAGEQIMEGAVSAIADVAVVPFMHKAALGKQIGRAEKASGVITRPADKLPTSGNVGEVLNTLESQIDSGIINSPQLAKEAYGITKFVNSNPNIVGKSDEITVAAARVGRKAQALLNKLVPGRAEPAGQMARAMTVPRTIGNTYKKLPGNVRRGIGGASAIGGGGLIYELGKRLLGQNR